MNSITTRTPPLPSRNLNQNHSTNQFLPSKPIKNIIHTPMLDQRPDTPRFHKDTRNIVPPLFVNRINSINNENNNNNNNNKNILGVGSSKQTNKSILIDNIKPNNANGKRVAADIDLTNTTGGVSPPSSVPPTKKSKTGNNNNNENNNNNNNNKQNNSATRVESKSKAKHDKAIAESVAWRQKFKKAFPSFVFYFDALDPITELNLKNSVERLGATVNGFFSKTVTHVVSSRTIPPPLNVNKENFNSPSIPQAQSRNGKSTQPNILEYESIAGPSRTKKSIGRSPTYSLNEGQKHRQQYDQTGDRNPFIVDSKDILSKAAEFGLKIWRLDKAQLVISRINAHSPTKADNQRNISLPSLLRDEQVYGTRERDPFVPRADTHYFSPQSCYVLVEDSTGEHRPIVTKEYERPRKREDPSWPVLWGGVESRTAFYHYEGPPVVHEAKRNCTSLYVVPTNVKKSRYFELIDTPDSPITSTTTAEKLPTNLRRSISLNQIKKSQNNVEGGVHDNLGDKYIAASGNSQIITSNIASGTSNQSGAIKGAGHGRDSIMCNRRLATLKRLSVPMGAAGVGVPGKLKRSASLDAGLNVRAPPAREEPKKPGYCENCRIKYEDFKMHVVSRKHLKFARTASNWTDLDNLLARIVRTKLETYSSDCGSPVEEADSGYFESDEVECVE